MLFPEPRGLFKCVSKLQHTEVGVVPADDLHTHRQPLRSKPAGHRNGRMAGDGDVIAALHPVDVGLHLDSVDFLYIGLFDVKWRYLVDWTYQIFIGFHKFPHPVEKFGVLDLGPADLRAREVLALFDIPDHGILHQLPL